MRSFRDLPIRFQLTFAMVAACVGVLTLASGAFVAFDEKSSFVTKQRTLSVLGGVMAQTLAGPVAFRDEGSTGIVLANLASEPTARMSAVYVADGTLLTSWAPDETSEHMPATLDAFNAESHDGLVLVSPIVGGGGEPIGSLVSWYGTEDLDRRLRTFLIIAVSVALFSLLVVTLVIWSARSLITRPIDLLVEATDRVRAGNDYSVRVQSLGKDELGSLAETFNEMLEGIQLRDADLLAHREGLEQTVKDRTAELDSRNEGMRVVLDSVEQGLVVLDAKGVFSPERSASFDQWFGEPPEGSTLPELFEKQDARFASFFQLGWEMLFEDLMPREVCLDQLPTRFSLDERTFSIAYHVLEASDEPIESVLVMFTDVTAEEQAAKLNLVQQELANVFGAIQTDPNSFRTFLDEGETIVAALKPESNTEHVELLRRVHTLKGNASLQGLVELPPLCHDLETRLSDGETLAAEDLEAVVEAWRVFRQRAEPLLPKSFALQLDTPDVEQLRSAAQETPEVLALLDYLGGEPVDRRLNFLADRADALVERLGKEAVVEVDAAGLRTPPGWLDGIWYLLPHVVRNAVDHGIEAPERRAEVGKPPEAKLTLRARQGRTSDIFAQDGLRVGASIAPDASVIAIDVLDDGAGVNWAAVAAKAEAAGMKTDTNQALLVAMFSDGVSTAAELTDVSGRGVGTAAVLQEVTETGGCIELVTQAGKGTRLSIVVPLPSPALVMAV